MNINCTLFYGDDSYLIKKNLEILFKTHEIDDQDIEQYDYEEDGLETALNNAMTLPFLSVKKGVVIRNCTFLSDQKSASAEDTELLKRYCSYVNPTTILALLAPYEKLDMRKNIVKYLKKHIDTVAYITDKKSNTIYDYIKEEVEKNHLTIDPLALTQFVNRIGNDPTMVENELIKLITYSYGKEVITSDMVYAVVTKNIDDNIFELVNAVIEKNVNQSMEIYKDLVSIKIDPIWMINVISSKFQEILYTKELIKQKYKYEDIGKYFNASKGRLYYMMQNAKNVEDDMLLELMSKIENLDYLIKSGQIDKNLGLELFLLDLE